MANQQVDWKELAEKLGTLSDDGESGSGELARRAIIELLGQDTLRNAVDYYVDQRRGYELARSVLRLLRPPAAMEECYRIYREDPDIERRRAAVELLRVVGDKRVLPFVQEFLGDPDHGIQNWGVSLLDNFLFSEIVEPEDAEPFLKQGEHHSNPRVQETIKQIRESIEQRQGR